MSPVTSQGKEFDLNECCDIGEEDEKKQHSRSSISITRKDRTLSVATLSPVSKKAKDFKGCVCVKLISKDK